MNKTKRHKEETVRLNVIFSFFILAGLVLISRLFFIQVVEGGEYAKRALDQYIRPAEALIDRGDIYLSPKNDSPLPVASIQRTYTAYVNPNVTEDPEAAFDALSAVIDIEREEFFKKATKADDPYEALVEKLDQETAQQINSLGLPGIATHDDPTRTYPMESLAAHVIGFMSYDENIYTGTHGIERSMNETLTGSGDEQNINVFAEVLSGLGGEESEPSADVILTIDPSVQIFVEKKLAVLNERYNSTQSGAIVLDPKTGDIIAMASHPTFDLGDYGNTDPALFTNPSVERVFEMGSIIKPLTVASGIDNGTITPNTIYQDNGTIDLDGYEISNYDDRGRGLVDMQAVLNQSLNTGVAFIAEKMGHDAFRSYFKTLFSGTTGVALPFETENLTDNLDSPRKVEYATASFGQGLVLTPLATARALSTLGNGGLLVSPRIIKEIRYDDGTVVMPEREEPTRVFDPETSETISRMLVRVFDEALLGGEMKLDTHTIAAKTGTAQMVDSQGGGYSENEFFHSFFGYFPAYEPEFLILIYTERPQGAEYASDSLTEPFIDVTNFLIDYYNIPPDR